MMWNTPIWTGHSVPACNAGDRLEGKLECSTGLEGLAISSAPSTTSDIGASSHGVSLRVPKVCRCWDPRTNQDGPCWKSKRCQCHEVQAIADAFGEPQRTSCVLIVVRSPP